MVSWGKIGDVEEYVGDMFDAEDEAGAGGDVDPRSARIVNCIKRGLLNPNAEAWDDDKMQKFIATSVVQSSELVHLIDRPDFVAALAKLFPKYCGDANDVARHVCTRLGRAGQNLLFNAKELINNIPNLAILDLGCGNNLAVDQAEFRHGFRSYEPWFCRLFHEIGAKVTGIDRHPLYDGRFFANERDEGWRYFAANLFDDFEVWKNFKPEEFDLVNMTMFMPHWVDGQLEIADLPRNASPALIRCVIKKAVAQNLNAVNVLSDCRNKLVAEVLRVLKPGGILLIEFSKYVKAIDPQTNEYYLKQVTAGRDSVGDDLSGIRMPCLV